MSGKNINFLNNIKVRHKLIIIYIVCVVAPIIIINLIFYFNMAGNTRQLHKNYYNSSTKRIVSLIDKDLNFLISQAHKIYMDQKLYEMLDRDYGSNLDYVESYFDFFRSYLYLNGEAYEQIKEMVIYTENPTILHSGKVFRLDDKLRDERWFNTAMESPHKLHLFYGQPSKKADGTIETPVSIIRVLNHYQGLDRHLKILKIDINVNKIMEIINQVNVRGDVLVLHNENRLLFSNTTKDIEDLSELTKNDEQVIKSKINDYYDWSIVNIMNQEDLQKALQKPRNRIILLTLISLFLSSFILILFYRSFYVRLNSLSEHVKNLDQDDFTSQYRGLQGKDEIGDLIKAFNRMVKKIKLLITDVYESKLEKSNIELEKKQAELNALQSQLNPHYLFNTLESIRMKSLEKQEVETAKIIKNLASSFRRIITNKQEWITVAEELNFIKDFLKIQKYRFGDEFEYNLKIDSAALDFKIPKLIIQPFVENACIHGVGRTEEKGSLLLEINLMEDKLKCIIKDNGIGIEEDKLKTIYDNFEMDRESYNIGIQNIYKRLKLYYGDHFQLKIDSEKGKGTCIILVIPREVKYV